MSALRFYDGAGVLRPAVVDERTGYRRYTSEQVRAARLVARLRRVGMPLPSVRRLIDPATAPAEACRLLDEHLARLEGGLADARRELSAVRSLLDGPLEDVMTLSVPAAGLAAAFDAVRFAVGTDPERPVLGTVLLERDGALLRLVATDRYRLAVGSVPCAPGEPVRVLLPVPLVDAARALLAGATGDARLTVAGDAVTLDVGDRSVRGTQDPGDFPDWRGLEPKPLPHRVPLDVPAFRAALAAGPAIRKVRQPAGVEYETVVLVLGADGELTVGGAGDGLRVGVNRDFLLDALTGARSDELVLELDGPITPLAVRVPGGAYWSLLMPVDLDDPVPA